MQDTIVHISTFLQRVDNLKVATGESWESIAKRLGLSRSSIHLLRRGHHPPTKATLQRLTEAEIQAGLRKSAVDSNRLLVDFLLSRPEEERIPVSAQHVDQGTRLVPVKYRRGDKPADCDEEIPVRAPREVKHTARLWVQLLLDEDLENLLLECLDPKYATKEFLKLLDPKSFLDLAEAAIALTIGVGWRQRFPELAKGIERVPQNQSSQEIHEQDT
jgi:transcriptional regulator with XRE-family HTH domain